MNNPFDFKKNMDVRHFGITINGNLAARITYDALAPRQPLTADPFASTDDERLRFARRAREEESALRRAEAHGRRYQQSVIDILTEVQATATVRGLDMLAIPCQWPWDFASQYLGGCSAPTLLNENFPICDQSVTPGRVYGRFTHRFSFRMRHVKKRIPPCDPWCPCTRYRANARIQAPPRSPIQSLGDRWNSGTVRPVSYSLPC